ncbi:MAG: hypothetical protein R3Y64_02000 [Peptostreptococcaceae bacterium]
MNNKGYLLIEYIVSITIIAFIGTFLVNSYFLAKNIMINVYDKREIMSQALEISDYIDKLIANSKGIISIDDNFIKLKYKEYDFDEDKVIIFRDTTQKVAVNNLYMDGSTKPGGYEIGAYVYDFDASFDGQIIDITLKLKKGNSTYETEFSTYIMNS